MTSLQNCIDWNTNAVALTIAGRKDEAISTIDQLLEWVNNVGGGDLNKAREYLLRLRKIRGEG